MFDQDAIKFRKKGSEIKDAVRARCAALRSRLEHRNKVTDPGDPVASKLNSLPKFVASRTRTTFSWSGSSHIRDVGKEVPDLKQRFAREVQVHGSGGLAQTLIENDLIDEYKLLTFPVILGTGRRLFGSGAVPASLTLVSSHTTGTGIVVSVYRRAGSLKTGSF